jgi:rhodanese-related sulfurtransferase
MRSALCVMASMVFAHAATLGPTQAETASIYQATLAEHGQKTAEITTEEMRKVLAQSSATVIDTRTRAEFDAGHIPGAHVLGVPPAEAVAAVTRLAAGDKSKALVLYCNGPFCQASRRLADALAESGFTDVRRYQLGLPVWRALGGPVAVEIGGIARVIQADRTAVILDGRTAAEFAHGSVAGAHNVPADELASGALKKLPLPEDDFNRRVILFARDGLQARKMADVLGTRPWHNVSYFAGPADEVMALSSGKSN